MDGDCVDRCTLDQETCLKCDGAGNCIDDPSKCTGECETCSGGTCIDDDSKCTGECATCSDGNCEYECNIATQVCCDDVCTDRCQEYFDPLECSASQNDDCLKCQTDEYLCSDNFKRIHTGDAYILCGGGCSGDCQEPFEVLCYIEYSCLALLPGEPFNRCMTESMTGDIGLHCEFLGFEYFGWCVGCLTWDEEQHYTTQELCKEY